MKKLSVLLLAFAATGCAKFHDDGTSVFQGGLWLVPLIPFLLCLWFVYKGYTHWKSGSTQQIPTGGQMESDERVPLYQVKEFVFAIIFLICAVAFFIGINMSR